MSSPLAFLVLAALSVPAQAPASPQPAKSSTSSVTAIPFGDDVPGRALFAAVEGALPSACRERGISAVRADKVKPVREALARCTDDACRLNQARRLGARWALLGRLTDAGLSLRIVGVETAQERAARTAGGTPPQVLAAADRLVEELVEAVAPRATHRRAVAVEKAHKARKAGDREAADAAYAEALAVGLVDEETADVWIARARLWDESGDRARAFAAWDALAAAVGPAAPPELPLDEEARKRVAAALLDHLKARATFQLDVADADAGPDKPALLEVAARTHLTIAQLFPQERGEALFSAAEIFRDAGNKDEALKLYDQVLAEPTASDELKVRATARRRL